MKLTNMCKKCSLFVLVGVMSLGLLVPDTSAATKKTKAKNAEATAAYRYFLMSDQVIDENVCSTKENLKFAVLDINHDGIKEILTTGDDLYHACIYSYVDDEVKLIDDSFAGSYVWYTNKNLVFSNTAHTGYYPESYEQFKNGKMKVLANAEGEDYFDAKNNWTIRYKYYIKGKKTTKKKYIAYAKSLTKNAKEGKIVLHANTAKNRKKYIK